MEDYTNAEKLTAEKLGKSVEEVHEVIETYMSALAELSQERRKKIEEAL